MSEPSDKPSTVRSRGAPKVFSISQRWVLQDSYNQDDEKSKTVTTMEGKADEEMTLLRDALVETFVDGKVSEQASNVESLYGFIGSGVSKEVYDRMNEVYEPTIKGQEFPYTREHVSEIVRRSYNSHIARAYGDITREEEAIRSRFDSSNQQSQNPLPTAISQSITAANPEGNTQATDDKSNWDLSTRRRRDVMHNRLMNGNIDMSFREGDAGGWIVMSIGEGGGWSGAPTRTRATFNPTGVSEVMFETVGQFSVPFPVASGLPSTEKTEIKL